jgi:hypothetical protein
VRVHRDLVEERLPNQLRPPEPEPAQQAEAELPTSNAVTADAQAASRLSPAAVLQLQRTVGNQAVSSFLDRSGHPADGQSRLDVVTTDESDDGTGAEFLDQADGGVATAAPDAGTADAGTAPAAAVPTSLRQILTSWTPGPTKYGFQLKFQCSSSSGRVADLQAQAPNLVWREYVTYSRNDFAHRINPPSPTILPTGGVSFSTAKTTVIGPNLLEFNGVTDTHWMPTSAVRREDWKPAGTRELPGIMESTQLYQFSTDGSTWTTFAGPFTLRRTLERAAGPPAEDGAVPLVFITDKNGIHSVTEPYKP